MARTPDPERLHNAKLRKILNEPEQEGDPQQKSEQGQTLNESSARSLADQRIQEAMERGEFDNLQGAGKPLNLYDDIHVPEDMRMAYRLLKNNNLAPTWIELRKGLLQEHERLVRFQRQMRECWAELSETEQAAARSWVQAFIEDANSRILSYNLTAPSASVHLELYRLQDQLSRLHS